MTDESDGVGFSPGVNVFMPGCGLLGMFSHQALTVFPVALSEKNR